MPELLLWFVSYGGEVQLERSVYVDATGSERVAVRGKGRRAYKGAGVFQWTPGVQALAVVFLTALMRHLKQVNTYLPLLEGEKRSLAYSLYYALAKQPEWLFEMFGSDDAGDAALRQLLFRSDLRTGKIAISLNEQILPASSIKIYLDGVELVHSEEIERLVRILRAAETATLHNEPRGTWVLNRSHSTISSKCRHSLPVAQGYNDPDNLFLFEQLQFPSESIADRLGWEFKNSEGQTFPSVYGRIVQAKHLFEELTYETCDAKTREQVDQWIGNMEPEPDAEWGIDTERNGRTIPGFLNWIKDFSRKFTPNGFHQTFIWRDRQNKEIIATLTLCPDDRGVEERNQLHGDGYIGGGECSPGSAKSRNR